MLGTIVTPMQRGQITLPKVYSEKLGIVPGTPLNVTLEGEKIMIVPLKNIIKGTLGVIKPSTSKKDYISLIKSFRGGSWTYKDDKARLLMKKKEEILDF